MNLFKTSFIFIFLLSNTSLQAGEHFTRDKQSPPNLQNVTKNAFDLSVAVLGALTSHAPADYLIRSQNLETPNKKLARLSSENVPSNGDFQERSLWQQISTDITITQNWIKGYFNEFINLNNDVSRLLESAQMYFENNPRSWVNFVINNHGLLSKNPLWRAIILVVFADILDQPWNIVNTEYSAAYKISQSGTYDSSYSVNQPKAEATLGSGAGNVGEAYNNSEFVGSSYIPGISLDSIALNFSDQISLAETEDIISQAFYLCLDALRARVVMGDGGMAQRNPSGMTFAQYFGEAEGFIKEKFNFLLNSPNTDVSMLLKKADGFTDWTQESWFKFLQDYREAFLKNPGIRVLIFFYRAYNGLYGDIDVISNELNYAKDLEERVNRGAIGSFSFQDEDVYNDSKSVTEKLFDDYSKLPTPNDWKSLPREQWGWFHKVKDRLNELKEGPGKIVRAIQKPWNKHNASHEKRSFELPKMTQLKKYLPQRFNQRRDVDKKPVSFRARENNGQGVDRLESSGNRFRRVLKQAQGFLPRSQQSKEASYERNRKDHESLGLAGFYEQGRRIIDQGVKRASGVVNTLNTRGRRRLDKDHENKVLNLQDF